VPIFHCKDGAVRLFAWCQVSDFPLINRSIIFDSLTEPRRCLINEGHLERLLEMQPGDLEAISRRLTALRAKGGPGILLSGAARDLQWVRPRLRCRVSFQEMTRRGHFQAPAFERLLR